MMEPDLTWQCDHSSCERDAKCRHERGAGVFCQEHTDERVMNSLDPRKEEEGLYDVFAEQLSKVEQIG